MKCSDAIATTAEQVVRVIISRIAACHYRMCRNAIKRRSGQCAGFGTHNSNSYWEMRPTSDSNLLTGVPVGERKFNCWLMRDGENRCAASSLPAPLLHTSRSNRSRESSKRNHRRRRDAVAVMMNEAMVAVALL